MQSQRRCQLACLRSHFSAGARPRLCSASPAGQHFPSGTFGIETKLFPGPVCPLLPVRTINTMASLKRAQSYDRSTQC